MKSWTTIEVPEESSVSDLIFELSKATGFDLAEKLMDRDKIRSEFRILVNGRDLSRVSGAETKLKDNDVISILPVVAGG